MLAKDLTSSGIPQDLESLVKTDKKWDEARYMYAKNGSLK
jgi:hypothetical protein